MNIFPYKIIKEKMLTKGCVWPTVVKGYSSQIHEASIYKRHLNGLEWIFLKISNMIMNVFSRSLYHPLPLLLLPSGALSLFSPLI